MEVLKASLTAQGLKCGGTAAQRADRLFSTKGKPRAQWDKKILAGKPKGAAASKAGGKSKKETVAANHKALALTEAKVYKVTELLAEIRTATQENVERKQAQTAAEREAENQDVDIVDEDQEPEDDDGKAYDSDNELIYNPKDLPLDVFGKPIPYWLYKLHGLNIRYECEICGNFTYRGPKAFQRHFSEWRHAHGMRCLIIPNTSHFHNVTLIQDAKQLWSKIQSEKNVDAFKADEEEYEDSQGNVMNKKTYEMMKKQGIL
jgi:splicing factor 3A subunit 3